MAITKITSNVLALSAAQDNINNSNALFISVPTQINNLSTTNLAVDVNTLFVDDINDRVGIGTSTPNERLTVSGNISASGNITGNNLVYTTTDQTIAGNKTFTNNIQTNGNINAPNQSLTSPGALINSNLLISLMENTAFGQYAGFVGNTGSNSQFAGQGAFGFSGSPVAGSTTARISYMFTKNSYPNDTTISGIAGAGYFSNFFSPFTIGFGFTTPIDNTARDVDVRVVYGHVGLSGTRVMGFGSSRFGGFGLKLTKHPTNNTYLTRLFTKHFDWGNQINISGASNASPIVITTPAPHNLITGDRVEIFGVGGNTAANGEWNVTLISPTTFSLNGSTGNGAYTTGTGTVSRVTSNFIELLPARYYRAFFEWIPSTQSVNFRLGTQTSTPSLSAFIFPNASLMPIMTYQVGHSFTASIASLTDATSWLGIQMSSPTLYQY